jgi:hypothetical protein
MTQLSIFKPSQSYPAKWYIFKNSELGKIHAAIPWDQLRSLLPEKSNRTGRPAWFCESGMFALMFLKVYSGLSDKKLIERLNTDWSYQLFCFRLFDDGEMIKDITLPSTIRSYLSSQVALPVFQQLLLSDWKTELAHPNLLLMDVTRSGTDV